jgi:hypothetical protein
MGVIVMLGRPFVWAYVRKRLIAAGFRVIQNGDWEGAALFDPHNANQARLAIRIIGAKRKRELSEAQRAILAEGMGRVRAFAGHSAPAL